MEFKSSILRQFKTTQKVVLTGIENHSEELKESMVLFLKKDEYYRLQFSQKEFEVGFDGYSFPGQLDSINQAYDDYLHSMVISEFYPSSKYPAEFKNYIEIIFPKLVTEVKEAINFDEILSEFGLENTLGFSFSVNYYPSYKESGFPKGPRLTEHIDGSLLTVFPYGFSEGLQHNLNGKWKDWPSSDQAICFPGYMMDLATNGTIKAMDHRLNWDEKEDSGRFAFALFVVPKPNVNINLGSFGKINTKEYYKKYLSLFD